METNNTTATSNVTSAESITKELKVSFTDNELQSIAINAMGRASEARNQAVTNISNFIKLLLLFVCSINFAYAENKTELGYDYEEILYKNSGFSDIENCSLPYYLNDHKCLHQVYQELDSRLNQAYKNIISSTIYPQTNKTALKNSQIAWIKSKEAECKKFSKNKDKLTSCYLDKTIDKINELWEIEANVIEKPFEGKWFSCFDRGNPYDNKKVKIVCVGYTKVQKGNNVCGTYQNWASGTWYTYKTLSTISTKNHIFSSGIKACSDGNLGDGVIDCYYNHDTYETIPVSMWDNSSKGDGNALQRINKKILSARIKTPFTQDELDKLSKIQWLQDCLNYKGE